MDTMRVAIQGELGSNSHMAALEMLAAAGLEFEIVPCGLSVEVFERLHDGTVDMAVLPIENSLHGSVFEHYDLLLEHGVTVVAESHLRIRHNVIAAPGVKLEEIRRVMSHPVALSQCRRWLRAHPEIEAVPFYDTAGSVKDVMGKGVRDAAGIAPELAARQYGAEVVVAGVEDHAENYTRFYGLRRGSIAGVKAPFPEADRFVGLKPRASTEGHSDKMSLAFSVRHEPGTLIGALEVFRDAGVNLTKIESRPVHGRPWEYVFFVDVRFESEAQVEGALVKLRGQCEMVKELGRYQAA
jgi:prephenate dehydratase